MLLPGRQIQRGFRAEQAAQVGNLVFEGQASAAHPDQGFQRQVRLPERLVHPRQQQPVRLGSQCQGPVSLRLLRQERRISRREALLQGDRQETALLPVRQVVPVGLQRLPDLLILPHLPVREIMPRQRDEVIVIPHLLPRRRVPDGTAGCPRQQQNRQQQG